MAQEMMPIGHYLPELENSDESSSQKSAMSLMWVLDQAEQLFRLFRNAKAEDKEAARDFGRAAVKTLSHYPAEVIAFVCSPEGLPMQHDWPPTLKQIAEACDKRMAPIAREREREQNLKRQFAGRRADQAIAKAPKTGAVARYLAERRKDKKNPLGGHRPGAPASAATLLPVYLEARAHHNHNLITLSPEARAIIEAAGLEIPA